MSNYNIITQRIRDNIADIRKYAMSVVENERLHMVIAEQFDDYNDPTADCDVRDLPHKWNAVEDGTYEELDHWDAYDEYADLNFVSEGLQVIKCYAYPVVNSVPDYSEERAVLVLDGTEEPF